MTLSASHKSTDPAAPPLAVVTGARGFLGSRVCESLRAAGWAVRPITRRQSTAGRGFVANPLDTIDQGRHALYGADAVAHCAGLAHQFGTAPTEAAFNAANAQLTARVAESAARVGVRRMVLISSSSVYGPGSVGAREDTPLAPATPYAHSKALGERLAREHCDRGGVGLTVLRPSAMYGVGDPGNVRRLIEAIARGRFAWVGDGANRKSLVAVEDVADAAAWAAGDSAKEPRCFNVAAPPVTTRELVDAIDDAIGHTPNRLRVPGGVAEGLASVAAGLGLPKADRVRDALQKWRRDDTIDATAYERQRPTFVWRPLRESIRTEVQWVLSNHGASLQAA